MRIILLTVFLLGLVSCGGDDTANGHLDGTGEYLEGRDLQAVEIELTKILELNPSSAEARFFLGKVYLDRDENLAAESELSRAQQLGWSVDEVAPALARALLAQGSFTEVLDLDPSGLSDTGAASLLAAQSLAAMLEGDREKAVELVTLALVKDPESVDAALVRARMSALLGDAEGALGRVEKVLAKSPINTDAWRLKGHMLWQERELKEALDAFNHAIAHASITFADRVSRALINLQLGDINAAQADAEALQKLAPGHASAQYVDGLLYFNRREYRHAITALAKAEPSAEKFPLLLYYRSVAHLIDKDIPLAALYMDKYVSRSPDSIEGRQLLALLRLLEGQPYLVSEVLQPVLDYNPNDVGSLNILANAYLYDDLSDRSLLLLQRLSTLRPDMPIDQLSLTSGLLTEDLLLGGNAVLQDLENALEPLPAFPREEILQILLLLQKGDFTGAIQAAESYKWQDLTGIAPYNVLGSVYHAAGKIAEAREVFEQGLNRDPGNPSANMNMAQIAREEGDTAAEAQYYETILEMQPKHLPSLLQLARLDGKRKGNAALQRRLEQAVFVVPGALEPRLSLSTVLLDAGKPDKALAQLTGLHPLQQRSPRVLVLFARAQLALQQYDSAYHALQQLVAANPNSADNQYLLSRATRGRGELGKTKHALSQALALDPNHEASLLAMAQLVAAEGDQAALEPYLTALVKVAPDNVEVLRLRASAAQLKGSTAEALKFSKRAFRLAPSTAALLQVTALQKAAGEGESARNFMRQWVGSHPRDVAVRLALSDELQLEGDFLGAQAQYLAVLRIEPGNVIALNNLALNLRNDDPARALKLARRAAGLAPEDPAVLDTLAMIEHFNGKNRAAKKSIERALAGAPDNLTMRYHEAVVVAALGERERAVATLTDLVAQDEAAFPEWGEAQQLLTTLRE